MDDQSGPRNTTAPEELFEFSVLPGSINAMSRMIIMKVREENVLELVFLLVEQLNEELARNQ